MGCLQSDEDEEEGSEDGALGDGEHSDTHDSATVADDGTTEDEEDASPATAGDPNAGQAGREAGAQTAHRPGANAR